MPLETKIVSAAPEEHSTPLLAVLVPQGRMPDSLSALDRASGGALERLYAAETFAGKADETATLYPPGPVQRLLLVGAGQSEDATLSAVRRAGAVAGRVASGLGVGRAACWVVPEIAAVVGHEAVAQGVTEGLAFGAWRFDEMKEPPKEERETLAVVEILAPLETGRYEDGHKIGAAVAAGQHLTRNLQVLPANTCTPSYLAEVATDLGKRHDIDVTVLDHKAIAKEGMGALLAVARGSASDPRFVVLDYRGAEGSPIVLVGKGVTFDTGGISLKPAHNMEDMKFDMSGAAAVLGTFEALGRLRPKVRVVGLIPAAENMPSGTAVKPGDVIKTHSGKTVEVINTDAEGRLLLCDALSYARRFNPACVLDIATLTGAVVIALGNHAIGIMGNDDALIEAVRTAGERAGERVWPLPLWDDYRDLIKSEIADIKNSGGRPAGCITAAWFLKEFVNGYPWVHLDIAGTAYLDRAQPTMVKGPTGAGVRLFTEFVLARQG